MPVHPYTVPPIGMTLAVSDAASSIRHFSLQIPVTNFAEFSERCIFVQVKNRGKVYNSPLQKPRIRDYEKKDGLTYLPLYMTPLL